MTNIHKAAREALEALNAMLTHMGMDEDEWNKPTFNQARAALATLRAALDEAPGEEREAFEAWARSQNWPLDRDSFGEYVYMVARAGWTAWQARAMLAARPEAPTQPIGQVIDANRGANTGAAPETPMVLWFGQPAVGTHLYARHSAPTVALTEEKVSAWVPCAERMPEEGQSVAFVVRASNRLDYLNGKVLGGIFRAGPFGGFGVPGMVVDAWYWMPLPPPPQSTEGGA